MHLSPLTPTYPKLNHFSLMASIYQKRLLLIEKNLDSLLMMDNWQRFLIIRELLVIV